MGLAMDVPATKENFAESAYLAANPDVWAAVKRGDLESGRQHFEVFGYKEGRRQRISGDDDVFAAVKKKKFDRIQPLLRKDMPYVVDKGCPDFLSPQLRDRFAIIDTDAVSSNEYDNYAIDLIEKHRDGLILDCGAGRRSVYFENVVNFEIVAYDTTDVRGVGEALPFLDDSFDAVFSLAVLEHVKDPFACAREIVRVLKPGGDLMCAVPLLQPVHGYPHHYYNMTAQGLKNLFSENIEIDRHEVYSGVLPIWSLTWIVRSWAEGLTGRANQEFLNLRISDLLDSGDKYLDRSFVKELSQEKNFELASATVLFGHKTASPQGLSVRERLKQLFLSRTISGKTLFHGGHLERLTEKLLPKNKGLRP
jgi:SAM-dependent methyltransferase